MGLVAAAPQTAGRGGTRGATNNHKKIILRTARRINFSRRRFLRVTLTNSCRMGMGGKKNVTYIGPGRRSEVVHCNAAVQKRSTEPNGGGFAPLECSSLSIILLLCISRVPVKVTPSRTSLSCMNIVLSWTSDADKRHKRQRRASKHNGFLLGMRYERGGISARPPSNRRMTAAPPLKKTYHESF